MKFGLKVRLGVFIAAILVVGASMIWIARVSSANIRELHSRFTRTELESYTMAQNFQERLFALNNLMLRFGLRRNEASWQAFLDQSADLEQWLTQQGNKLKSPLEQQHFSGMNQAYRDYLAAARDIEVKIRGSRTGELPLALFAQFEEQSERMRTLSYPLAEARGVSLDQYLAELNQSLVRIKNMLFGAVSLLLIISVGLALLIYREMIAPLREKLEESQTIIERQDKLASLGMLASGLAHEIRNPLTAIKARLFTQQKCLKPGSPEADDAAVISQQIDRLERIVRDILQFSRPSEPRREITAAESPLREVQKLMTVQLEKKGIQLLLEAAPALRARMDDQQIQQVLINLVQNAAQALEGPGAIRLRARADRKQLHGRWTDVLVLEVQDTGKGIAPEAAEHLFDPFFSTRDGGTGLGLPIAARIVEKNGGILQYQCQPGKGATFGIILPRA